MTTYEGGDVYDLPRRRQRDPIRALGARLDHRRRTGPAAVHPMPLRTSWTAAELMACDFPEPRWAVPGIIAEGLTLLAGAPKVGKSWLALGLGIAVATGGKALGALDVTAGDVLYLALEDPPRRLQERLAKVLAHSPAPSRLTLSIACEPIPAGGARTDIGAGSRRTLTRGSS
ncbi:MAG: AAA family ATPase [Geodermatophilaceae bacterium]